jgi:hypothetical protein
MVSKKGGYSMIDGLNRIGFKQIAFGGADKGGSGTGRQDGPDTVVRGPAYNAPSNNNRDRGDTGPSQEQRQVLADNQAQSAADNRFFSTDQVDDKWGYTDTSGNKVSAWNDWWNGGGRNYGGEMFGSRGGADLDLNKDRYITFDEMAQSGNELEQNAMSRSGTAMGITPAKSGLKPTGAARAVQFAFPMASNLIGTLGGVGYDRPSTSLSGQAAINMAEKEAKRSAPTFGPTNTTQQVLPQNDNDNNNDSQYGALPAAPTPPPAPAAENNTYKRMYYKSSGAGLPNYLGQYASGKNIDEIVRLVNRDGKQYYLTIDGRYLDPSLFANAATGTKTYDQDGNVINN